MFFYFNFCAVLFQGSDLRPRPAKHCQRLLPIRTRDDLLQTCALPYDAAHVGISVKKVKAQLSEAMAKAVEHYTLHELADAGQDGKAYSTRNRKILLLNRWVLPEWGKIELRAVKTVAVEQWLKTLITTKFGEAKPLAGGTREKIRDAMSSIFNHAIRWEFVDRNPITGPTKRSGVRVSAKRERIPDILEIEEMQSLWRHLAFERGPWCFSTCRLGCAPIQDPAVLTGRFYVSQSHLARDTTSQQASRARRKRLRMSTFLV